MTAARSFDERRRLAERLIDADTPDLDTPGVGDQIRAALRDTDQWFADVAVTTVLVAGMRPVRAQITSQARVLVTTALLDCQRCPHLRQGPTAFLVNLGERRAECRRCLRTVRTPDPTNDDRCDFCEARGTVLFTEFTLRLGAGIVHGNACAACSIILAGDEGVSASPAQTVGHMLGSLDGARVPGGCDDCDAYQTVTPGAAGIWTIRVAHDDWCPRLARIRGTQGGEL